MGSDAGHIYDGKGAEAGGSKLLPVGGSRGNNKAIRSADPAEGDSEHSE